MSISFIRPPGSSGGGGSGSVIEQTTAPVVDDSVLWLHPSKTVNTNPNIPTLHEVRGGVWVEVLWKVSGAWQDTAPAKPALASDDFNRADGSLTGQTTPVGGFAWTGLRGGIHSVVTNAAEGPGDAMSVIDVARSDVTVSAILARTTFAAGIAARVVDQDNFWLFFVSNGTWYFRYHVAGVATNHATGGAVADGTKFTMALSGDLVVAYMNDAEVARMTSATHNTATKHGIYSSTGTSTPGRVDDFVVQA